MCAVKVEVINTGTELLLGEVTNTHGGYLGDGLLGLGLRVERQTAVPDGDAVGDVMREAAGRADVLLVTGGLGPTHDDITRECAAAWLGLELERDEEIADWLGAFFAERGVQMTEAILRQAMVPRGAEVLDNPNGTAPGLYLPAGLAVGSPHVFLLPGPPRELYPMFEEIVVPKLRDLGGAVAGRERRNLRFFGLGESEIAGKLDPALAEISGIEVGYCLGRGDVVVRCIGESGAVEAAAEVCRSLLGDYLVSEDGEEMEEVVVSLLSSAGQTLATAESCTGGLIASRITDVPGASDVFTHGFVTYANAAKEEILGVPRELLEQFGAVSEPVARAMADGCLRVSGCDHAVVCTGIAGPGGGSAEKPVGTVFLGIAGTGMETVVVHRLYRSAGSSGGRERFKMLTSQAGLELVRRRLRGIDFD